LGSAGAAGAAGAGSLGAAVSVGGATAAGLGFGFGNAGTGFGVGATGAGATGAGATGAGGGTSFAAVADGALEVAQRSVPADPEAERAGADLSWSRRRPHQLRRQCRPR